MYIFNLVSLGNNLKAEYIILQPIPNDLIDIIWQFGRPPLPSSKINALPQSFAGKTHSWLFHVNIYILYIV
jgi:hypothetical protein